MSKHVSIKDKLGVGTPPAGPRAHAPLAIYTDKGNVELTHAEADRLKIALDEVRGRYVAEGVAAPEVPSVVPGWPLRFAVLLPEGVRASLEAYPRQGFDSLTQQHVLEFELRDVRPARYLAEALEQAAANLRGMRTK